METFLLMVGFIFIIMALAVTGIIIPFMIQIDVCGSDSSRDI